jgi:hypothetical protein
MIPAARTGLRYSSEATRARPGHAGLGGMDVTRAALILIALLLVVDLAR